MLILFLVVAVATLISILFLAKFPSSSGRGRVLERAAWYVGAGFFAFTTLIFGVQYGAPADSVLVTFVGFCGVSAVVAVYHVFKAFQNLVRHMVRVEKKNVETRRATAEGSSPSHHTRRMSAEEAAPPRGDVAPLATPTEEVPKPTAEVVPLEHPLRSAAG